MTRPSPSSTLLASRPRSLVSALALAALVAAIAGAMSACGTGGRVSASADKDRGAALFKEQCASCHALKAANARGRIGPDLDAAFKGARDQGIEESTIREVVAGQIQFAAPPMPTNLVKGDDVDAVAAYVAAYAGTGLTPAGGGGGGAAGGGGGGGTDGKSIFASNCASCHVLKAANAAGKIGPNLDESKPDLARTREQVIKGGGAMPAFKGQLTDKQIEAVSKFVANAAKSG